MDESIIQELPPNVYTIPKIADTLVDVIYETTKQHPKPPRFDQDPQVRRAQGINYIYGQVKDAMRLARKQDPDIWRAHPNVGSDLHVYNQIQMEHILATLISQMNPENKKNLAKNLQRAGLSESVISQARTRLLHQEEMIQEEVNLQQNEFLQPKEPTAA